MLQQLTSVRPFMRKPIKLLDITSGTRNHNVVRPVRSATRQGNHMVNMKLHADLFATIITASFLMLKLRLHIGYSVMTFSTAFLGLIIQAYCSTRQDTFLGISITSLCYFVALCLSITSRRFLLGFVAITAVLINISLDAGFPFFTLTIAKLTRLLLFWILPVSLNPACIIADAANTTMPVFYSLILREVFNCFNATAFGASLSWGYILIRHSVNLTVSQSPAVATVRGLLLHLIISQVAT